MTVSPYHLTALLIVLSIVSPVAAQPDPFGAAPQPAPAEAPPQPVARPAAPAVDPTKPEPLAIEMLRASNPSSPQQLIAAARAAFDFGRPDEAKRYLARLVESKPADDALASLTTRNADFLLQIGQAADLQPEGGQAATMILDAANKVAQDSQRIAKLLAQLSDPNPGQRQDALGKLAAAGTHVINPALRILADPSRESEHANIRAALVAMGATTELPLMAALETTDQKLQLQIIAMLGRMRSKRAVLPLIPLSLDAQSPAEVRQLATAALQAISGAAPDLYEAEKYLRRYAEQYFRGDLDYERSVDDHITLWSWDQANLAASPIALPRHDAGVFLAARVASNLYTLKPADDSTRRFMLLTNLELAKVRAGLDQPLPFTPKSAGAVAVAAGPHMVNLVLLDAMRLGRVPAAIAAAEVLGQINDLAALHCADGSASPIAQALTFSDRRVRLAAALTAVKLSAGEPFVGAGRLTQTLGWFISTSGSSSVLVGHPRGEDAQSLVGFMNALGYEGESAFVGRMLTERAFANPDFDFILIADSIDSPPVEELVQWLRRDFRTARQPIGVMARTERFETLRNTLAGDPFTIVLSPIYSDAVAANNLQQLKAIAGRNLVSPDERIAQARAAFAALTILAKKPATLLQYDLLTLEPAVLLALQNSALTADAAAVLGLFGTPRSQSALIDFASQTTRALSDRQAAASAFVAAVKSRGLLLTQQRIAAQYARYNASEKLDPPTQELLGILLDAIEAPAIDRGELSRAESP
jgi:hypothetical protein